MTAFFSRVNSTTIRIMLRAEGPGGMIGDGGTTLHPGDEFYGYSYGDFSRLLDRKVTSLSINPSPVA